MQTIEWARGWTIRWWRLAGHQRSAPEQRQGRARAPPDQGDRGKRDEIESSIESRRAKTQIRWMYLSIPRPPERARASTRNNGKGMLERMITIVHTASWRARGCRAGWRAGVNTAGVFALYVDGRGVSRGLRLKWILRCVHDEVRHAVSPTRAGAMACGTFR